MTLEEAKKAIDSFKAKGKTDEEIVATLYIMFQDDKLNVEELNSLIGLVGYELTDEFLNMTPEEQKDPDKVFEEREEEPLDELVDKLYEYCAYEHITQEQLQKILSVLEYKFNENYLTRFEIKKERKEKGKNKEK